MQNSAPAINLEDVTLTLSSAAGPVSILAGVSLTVGAGETVALLGPSGSGKSSLLMVAAGLEAATSGRVTIAGTDITHMGEDGLARFRRAHVGIVFQSFHLIPTMTALENVAVPLELAGARDAFERAKEELEAVGLGARLDHYPGQLSGGEQQRVALARAWALRPEVLFLDEPSANLDPGATHEIERIIGAMHTAGTKIVLVTHNLGQARRMGDEILFLLQGRVVERASTEAFFKQPASREAAQFLEGELPW